MNYQAKAFHISFLLHSVMIVFAVIFSAFMGQSQRVIVLDFDLHKPVPNVKKVDTPVSTPFIKAESVNPTTSQILKEKEPPRLQEESPMISTVPTIPTVVKLPEAHNLKSRPMGPGISDHARAIVKEGSAKISRDSKEGLRTSSTMGDADSRKELAKKKYLNDHFAYIRDKIFRNVSYPDAAKRMGWQGKVLLSFIITADGSVRAFKIIQSSGFSLLDKSAIETVRDAAPFPKPPGEAQLVIPITYRLG
jgi:periplasmic protein TonB